MNLIQIRNEPECSEQNNYKGVYMEHSDKDALLYIVYSEGGQQKDDWIDHGVDVGDVWSAHVQVAVSDKSEVKRKVDEVVNEPAAEHVED